VRSEQQGERGEESVIETATDVATRIDADASHDDAAD
jgi:hypothetical protein